MGAYNVINPGTIQAGQPEDVSQVLANLNAIAAVLNGNIDNTNLAAGILASKLAGYPADATKFLSGGGTWVAAGYPAIPKITVSTMAGGPPGAPSDGDIWIATAVDANGTRWTFQYNAGSASASKWEFIGGPYAFSVIETIETLVATGVVSDLATVGPSFVTPRAGDWEAEGQIVSAPGAGGGTQTLFLGNGLTGGRQVESCLNGSAAQQGSVPISARLTGVGSGVTIKVQYQTNTANAQFKERTLRVRPIRIA